MFAKSSLYNEREARTGFLFVMPALLFMVFMIGYPLIYNFQMSMSNLDVRSFKGNTSEFVGLENYITLFKDEVFVQALAQTFTFTIWNLIIQFTLGFALAIFFNKKFHLAGPIRGMIIISWMMPMSVTGLLFKNMFGTEDGVINDLLVRLGLMAQNMPIGWMIDGKFALWSVIVANCWVGIPFNMLLLTTGMTSIPEEVYESAAIDGANSFQRFWHLTVPLLKPAILSVLMLGFIYTFKVFDLVFIMTQGGPLNATEVLSTFSYKLSFTEYRFGLGATGAVILFLNLMIVGIFYLRLIRHEEVA